LKPQQKENPKEEEIQKVKLRLNFESDPLEYNKWLYHLHIYHLAKQIS